MSEAFASLPKQHALETCIALRHIALSVLDATRAAACCVCVDPFTTCAPFLGRLDPLTAALATQFGAAHAVVAWCNPPVPTLPSPFEFLTCHFPTNFSLALRKFFSNEDAEAEVCVVEAGVADIVVLGAVVLRVLDFDVWRSKYPRTLLALMKARQALPQERGSGAPDDMALSRLPVSRCAVPLTPSVVSTLASSDGTPGHAAIHCFWMPAYAAAYCEFCEEDTGFASAVEAKLLVDAVARCAR